MRNIYFVVMLLAMLVCANTNVNAQCDPILRPDSSQLVFNGPVYASAKVGNTLYVGGNFTSISLLTGGFVKVDGLTTGNPLNLGTWPKTNGAVNGMVSDGSGGWIIVGTFTQVGSSTRNRVAQINAAGQVTTFDPNANGQVITAYRNGTTLYVGGAFTTIGGQSRNRIASFDLTTGNITTWNPNANGNVNTITTSGATVYAGGAFTTIGGQTRNRIAALDATGVATAWNPNVTTGSTVSKILINGTTVYLGGAFTAVNSTSRTNVAAVDINTAALANWNPATNGSVTDLAINGTNILVSGLFSSIGSQPRNSLGEVDNNLGNATSRNFNLPLSTINVMKLSGNSLYIGGTFTTSSGSVNVARLNMTTNVVDAWQSNLNSTVFALDLVGNVLYVGGNFTSHNRTRTNMAAIDWAADTVLTWNQAVNGTVQAMVTDAANNIYIGGSFTTVGGTARNRLASFDASGALTSFNPNMNSTVQALVVSGNTLYAGGAFTTVGGSQPRQRAASFDITTGTITSWDPNITGGNVLAMAIAGSNMYFGGAFTGINNPVTTRMRAGAVNLASGTVNGWNPQPDASVNTLVASGSNIYIGGAFNMLNTALVPRLAQLDQTSGLPNVSWLSSYPSGTVNSIAINNGIMFVAGAFVSVGGQPRSNLAALNIATGNATTWDPAPNANTSFVSVHADRLIVGGTFNTISGQTNTPNVAQYNLLQTAPSVTITGNNSVCASTSVTFTAVTAAAGATYQWKRNSINVGTGLSTYTVIPANNDQIQCVITVPAGCYTPTTVTSNTITVSVTAPITPTVSISGNSSVCSGTPTTYTATTNLAAPTYQWMVNGNNVGTNNAVFTYTPSNGDAVTCKVIAPTSGCFSVSSVTSTPINVIVNTPVAPTISISTPLTTVCNGASVTFTSTTNVTGGTYQWRRNANPITGATSATLITATISNGDVFTCVVTIPVGGCYTASTSTSNGITMTITPNVTTTITISGNTAPCPSVATTYTATTSVIGGTFQWKVNSLNVGTNSSTYAYAPAANDILTCVITAAPGTCYAPATLTSNALTIVPQTAVVPTATVSGSNNVCAGQFGNYAVTTNVIGGTYQWKVNGVNTGTSSTYTYVPVNGDVVTCVVTVPVIGCYTLPSVTSNSFTVTVNNPVLPTMSISTPLTTVCSGVLTSYTSTSNVTGGTYQWKINNTNVIGAINPGFAYFPSNGDIVTCVVTVPSGACFLATSSLSNQITMNVTTSIVPTVSVTPDANNVCAGTVVNYSIATNVTGGTYQWQVNSTNVGTSSTYSYTPANGDIVTCTVTVPGSGCFTATTVTSSPLTMAVSTPVVPMISVASNVDTVCDGSNVVLTATTNITGGTYLWKVNGFNAGTNSPTHTYVPTNNDIILCTIIAPPGCYSTTTATSQLKVIRVKAKGTISFALGAAPIVEIGSTVYVNTTVPAGINTYSIVWKNKGVTFATTTAPNASYTKAAGIDTVTATLTTTDGCYNASNSPEIYVHSVGTGINNVSKNGSIEVFPNPFNDRFTLNGVADGDKIVLYDITGRIVMQQQTVDTKQNGYQIIVSELPAGSYMLRVNDKAGASKANLPVRKF